MGEDQYKLPRGGSGQSPAENAFLRFHPKSTYEQNNECVKSYC